MELTLFCLFVFLIQHDLWWCWSTFSEIFCRKPCAAWFNNLVLSPHCWQCLTRAAWQVVIHRPHRWIFVDKNVFSVCCKAQRAEQARQELINQVKESAAKTLETIRGWCDFCRTLDGFALPSASKDILTKWFPSVCYWHSPVGSWLEASFTSTHLSVLCNLIITRII